LSSLPRNAKAPETHFLSYQLRQVSSLPSEACQVYPVRMNPEDVRRMVGGWQAIERREREERRKAGPDTAAAVQGALALMDLFGEMHGWPPAENEARRRDNELARALGSASAVSNKPMAKRPSQKIRKALADLAKAIHRLEAPSIVIGGIAVIAHGVARQAQGSGGRPPRRAQRKGKAFTILIPECSPFRDSK